MNRVTLSWRVTFSTDSIYDRIVLTYLQDDAGNITDVRGQGAGFDIEPFFRWNETAATGGGGEAGSDETR